MTVVQINDESDSKKWVSIWQNCMKDYSALFFGLTVYYN